MITKIKKVSGVFFKAMMVGFALSVILASCKSDEQLPEEPEVASVQRKLGNEQLIARAVCRVVASKGKSLQNSFQYAESIANLSIIRRNTNDTDNKEIVRYSFDFIKINDAKPFVAKRIDFPFLNETCGTGDIDVFLTSFETYVYADETKDKNRLQPHIKDELIVFRGEFGMYTCMENGGSFDLLEYSSHKRFGNNAIEKDFTPPIYRFFVKTENNAVSIACSDLNQYGASLDPSMKWAVLEVGNSVKSEALFTPEELYLTPEMSQQCTIISIGDGHFMVSGIYRLEKICFDELTVFLMKGQPAQLSDFKIGDTITVTFDKPYERYNPKVAMANIIGK